MPIPLVAAGVAAGVSAGTSAIMGAVQSARAKKLRGQAERFIPSPEDPEVRSLLNQVRRKTRAIETGTDPVTAAGKKIISRNLSTTQGNVVRSASGDPRRVLEGLRRTSGDASDATARLMASTYPASQYYTELGSTLLNKISARKFDLKMSQRAQLLREAAEQKTAANKNIAGAIGTAGGFTTSLLSSDYIPRRDKPIFR